MDAPTTATIHPWVGERKGRVTFGLFDTPELEWDAQVAKVRWAAGVGFDAYWMPDHPALLARDSWIDLAGLALTTERIRLGVLVSCVLYRSPGLLARMAADVDRLSGGRLVLGIGAGNAEPEFARLGLPFPGVPERQRAVEEAAHIILGAWGDAPLTFHGRHFRADGLHLRPGPLQAPRAPLLIAGGGERVTLRQVARYADASNFGPSGGAGAAYDLADVRRKLAALRRHCDDLGRPYEAILRTHAVLSGCVHLAPTEAGVRAKLDAFKQMLGLWRADPVAGTPAQVVAHYRALAEAGLEHFVVTFRDEESRLLFAEHVIPALTAATA